jgi:hypothetical protein
MMCQAACSTLIALRSKYRSRLKIESDPSCFLSSFKSVFLICERKRVYPVSLNQFDCNLLQFIPVSVTFEFP